MHIADGILKIEECVAWFALSLPFIGYGIKRIKDRSKVNPGYKALLAFLAAAVLLFHAFQFQYQLLEPAHIQQELA